MSFNQSDPRFNPPALIWNYHTEQTQTTNEQQAQQLVRDAETLAAGMRSHMEALDHEILRAGKALLDITSAGIHEQQTGQETLVYLEDRTELWRFHNTLRPPGNPRNEDGELTGALARDNLEYFKSVIKKATKLRDALNSAHQNVVNVVIANTKDAALLLEYQALKREREEHREAFGHDLGPSQSEEGGLLDIPLGGQPTTIQNPFDRPGDKEKALEPLVQELMKKTAPAFGLTDISINQINIQNDTDNSIVNNYRHIQLNVEIRLEAVIQGITNAARIVADISEFIGLTLALKKIGDAARKAFSR